MNDLEYVKRSDLLVLLLQEANQFNRADLAALVRIAENFGDGEPEEFLKSMDRIDAEEREAEFDRLSADVDEALVNAQRAFDEKRNAEEEKLQKAALVDAARRGVFGAHEPLREDSHRPIWPQLDEASAELMVAKLVSWLMSDADVKRSAAWRNSRSLPEVVSDYVGELRREVLDLKTELQKEQKARKEAEGAPEGRMALRAFLKKHVPAFGIAENDGACAAAQKVIGSYQALLRDIIRERRTPGFSIMAMDGLLLRAERAVGGDFS